MNKTDHVDRYLLGWCVAADAQVCNVNAASSTFSRPCRRTLGKKTQPGTANLFIPANTEPAKLLAQLNESQLTNIPIRLSISRFVTPATKEIDYLVSEWARAGWEGAGPVDLGLGLLLGTSVGVERPARGCKGGPGHPATDTPSQPPTRRVHALLGQAQIIVASKSPTFSAT